MTNYLAWWPVLLGWPAVSVALSLGGLGVFQKRPRHLYSAAILILPISLYLAATPRFAFAALLAPLVLLLAGQAIKRNKINLAVVAAVPVGLFFCWLALVVLVGTASIPLPPDERAKLEDWRRFGDDEFVVAGPSCPQVGLCR